MAHPLFVSTAQWFLLPEGTEDLAGYPLYFVVACWGLRCDIMLTSAGVSRIFGIEQSKARDVLHYIRHEGRTRIVSEEVLYRDVRKRACRGVHIVSVDLSEGIPGKEIPLVEVEALPLKAGDINLLRQWMVSRRCGDQVPVELLTNVGE
ncbi:hypothetical protein [Citrobacter meridianamericanus]|uniref:CaiF/GrlA family transcriptional regulator n=1 Tax=Citrobacter meridianamericanus TaxID=2894201 RepID=A0ABT1BFG1_9ENTR|nr:hypothetical protein [Citrobacter meridianamericanus]MCO5784615.1 hypothetical protein [Citrobacter meridianamericanus]